MLTNDLVRVSVKGAEIRPRYVSVSSKLQRERAEALLQVFRDHVGKTRGALNEAIADLVAERTDFKLQKGLAKLLLDRSQFQADIQTDPVEIRARLFARAVEKGPVSLEANPIIGSSREALVEEVAGEFSLSPEELESALYGDLKGEEVLLSFRELKGVELLRRYNTALVQGVLLRASRLSVKWVGGDLLRLQAVFRAIRFHRLIHDIHGGDDGVEIRIDGPLSLFRLSTKYGLQMAIFFPALLLAKGWELEAEVEWNGQRGYLRVNSEEGLSSHYRDRGTWHSDEEKAFIHWLAEKQPSWSLSEAPAVFRIPGGEVWVPDLVLEHEDGTRVYIDLIGYWRKGSVTKRLERSRALPGTPRLILLSSRLRVDEGELEDLPATVIPFKGVLPGKKIVAAAETFRKRSSSP